MKKTVIATIVRVLGYVVLGVTGFLGGVGLAVLDGWIKNDEI